MFYINVSLSRLKEATGVYKVILTIIIKYFNIALYIFVWHDQHIIRLLLFMCYILQGVVTNLQSSLPS